MLNENEIAELPVSDRKVEANRRNASKSTGPRTARGRAHSRGNAMKHGLFAMNRSVAALTKWEDPEEYEALVQCLVESYQPVGTPEEMEVQFIAVCWWKRSRVWRYENANISGRLVRQQVEIDRAHKISPQGQTYYDWLRSAESEIAASGKISDELKVKMFADAGFRKLWDYAEESICRLSAREAGLPPTMIKEMMETDTDPDRRAKFLLQTTQHAFHVLLFQNMLVNVEGAKLARELEAIPSPEILDRVLRVEAAVDRSLGRAVHRLESLQLRRKEEAALSPEHSPQGGS